MVVMLFKDYHIPMIRSGSKTVTRREWDRAQVKPGGVYMAAIEMFTSHDECDCYIQAHDVYEQPLGETTDESARREGDYDDLDDFITGYKKVYGDGAWDPEKVVWVVEFEYVGREKPDTATRIAGCPNCPPDTFDTARQGMEAILTGEKESAEVVCDYHRAEINAEI